MSTQTDSLRVAAAQIAPVWLDRTRTVAKVIAALEAAAEDGARLVAFGEALVPGYPFWLANTDGARFESPFQKAMHAHYLREAVQIEAGHLQPVCDTARRLGLDVVLGVIERPQDRGGHSLYASLVCIATTGEITNVHRKLVPTHEERLAWSPGDGHGLRTQRLGPFTVGALNCWENWMPLPRAVLYAEGEDLHVALWPGGEHNTRELTRFLAREGRSYVISASGLMRRDDIGPDVPHRERLLAALPEMPANGGSAIAAPDGTWVVEPVVGDERVLVATIDHAEVRRERQNFDPAGHYSRPDVARLVINRERQRTVLEG
ncbi:MAG: carbon-nitrogen hydrolase family protein [Planctomycetes bacterium]|nr:carbon-nitrogen hydrolase family protein [Planctomycetota bacterium]